MVLIHKPGTTWNEVYQRARMAAPEAFDTHRIANLIGGEWTFVGETKPHSLAIDGSHIPGPPRISRENAIAAVEQAARQDAEWSKVPLEQRQQRVQQALTLLREHREIIALLLMWEIGNPWRLACADFDRCVDGIDWYMSNI